jgi:hypothetical protein
VSSPLLVSNLYESDGRIDQSIENGNGGSTGKTEDAIDPISSQDIQKHIRAASQFDFFSIFLIVGFRNGL